MNIYKKSDTDKNLRKGREVVESDDRSRFEGGRYQEDDFIYYCEVQGRKRKKEKKDERNS